LARMEEPDDLARIGIKSGQVRAFAKVAVGTGERQILRIVDAAVLTRNDVLDMKTQFGKLLRNSAVLTPMIRARPYKEAQLGIH